MLSDKLQHFAVNVLFFTINWDSSIGPTVCGNKQKKVIQNENIKHKAVQNPMEINRSS